jgi:hypothetical protein
LEVLKRRHEDDIFEGNRVVRRLVADLQRLQDQDDEELRKEAERNSWWGFLGKGKETNEEKQRRETERLQRLASRSIKEHELVQKQAVLQKSSGALYEVNSRIAAMKRQEEDEARVREVKRQEQLRKEEEARKRVEEEQARKKRQEEEARRRVEEERVRKKWEEEAARRRAEEERVRKKREEEAVRRVEEERVRKKREEEAVRRRVEEERVRKKREEEAVRRRVEEERVRKKREEEDVLKRVREELTKARRAQNGRHKPAANLYTSSQGSTYEGACLHDKFWPRLEGRYRCDNCDITHGKFAFQCPSCSMIACTACRRALRGERGRYDRSSRGRFDFDDDDWH